MNHKPTHSKNRWTLIQRISALTLAAVLAASFVPIGTAGGGDGTIGSLPGADGGDGSQNFFITGPRSMIEQVIVDAYGDGFVVPIDLPGDDMWLEFYGDVHVIFDQLMLDDHPELMLGLTAGFNGGGMMVVPEVDGEIGGQRWFVQMGFSLDTPYGRFEDLLDGQFSLHTLQLQSLRRGEISFDAAGGLLDVSQAFK